MFNSWFKRKKSNLILVIEDDYEPGIVLTKYIELQGYQTALARNGVEGLSLAEKLDPDLILLDIMLPKMDGFNVLTMLKSKPKTKNIPVLMCTALNMIDNVEKCCRNGAAGYITKPFDLNRIWKKIISILEAHKS